MAMTLEEFSRALVRVLPRMIRGITRREHNYLSQGKISLPQLSALEYLTLHSTCQMHELAHALGVTRAAATGLADRLIQQKLVRRRRDAKDRRVVWVEISPTGRKILRQIWEQKRKSVKEIFGQIDSRSRERYLHTIQKVVAILEKQ